MFIVPVIHARQIDRRHRSQTLKKIFGIAAHRGTILIRRMGDQYRHGDVMIEAMHSLPPKREKLDHAILAHGELTGHCHRIREAAEVDLYQTSNGLFLHVRDRAVNVVHEEHATIELPTGYYRVWRQREYIQVVRD